MKGLKTLWANVISIAKCDYIAYTVQITISPAILITTHLKSDKTVVIAYVDAANTSRTTA